MQSLCYLCCLIFLLLKTCAHIVCKYKSYANSKKILIYASQYESHEIIEKGRLVQLALKYTIQYEYKTSVIKVETVFRYWNGILLVSSIVNKLHCNLIISNNVTWQKQSNCKIKSYNSLNKWWISGTQNLS